MHLCNYSLQFSRCLDGLHYLILILPAQPFLGLVGKTDPPLVTSCCGQHGWYSAHWYVLCFTNSVPTLCYSPLLDYQRILLGESRGLCSFLKGSTQSFYLIFFGWGYEVARGTGWHFPRNLVLRTPS